jgi:hypothetical protein
MLCDAVSRNFTFAFETMNPVATRFIPSPGHRRMVTAPADYQAIKQL